MTFDIYVLQDCPDEDFYAEMLRVDDTDDRTWYYRASDVAPVIDDLRRRLAVFQDAALKRESDDYLRSQQTPDVDPVVADLKARLALCEDTTHGMKFPWRR